MAWCRQVTNIYQTECLSIPVWYLSHVPTKLAKLLLILGHGKMIKTVRKCRSQSLGYALISAAYADHCSIWAMYKQ